MARLGTRQKENKICTGLTSTGEFDTLAKAEKSGLREKQNKPIAV